MKSPTRLREGLGEGHAPHHLSRTLTLPLPLPQAGGEL